MVALTCTSNCFVCDFAVYYGSGVPLAKNGFGAYHKTVLDTRGHLLFDVQFSGLTGPLAWVALQQENRNVSFITDSFQSNRVSRMTIYN